MQVKKSLQHDSEKSNLFFKFVNYSNQISIIIAGIFLTSMMFLIVFNAIKRAYSSPIMGITEIVSWFAAITIIFSIGYTQLHKGHVSIDLLLLKLPLTIQKYVHSVINVISILFFSLAVYLLITYGFSLKENNVVSETLQFSYYPIVLICSIGFITLVLSLIKETIMVWKEQK